MIFCNIKYDHRYSLPFLVVGGQMVLLWHFLPKRFLHLISIVWTQLNILSLCCNCHKNEVKNNFLTIFIGFRDLKVNCILFILNSKEDSVIPFPARCLIFHKFPRHTRCTLSRVSRSYDLLLKSLF